MVQKKTTLVDDIDGCDADETVVFSLDGVSYEIDLAAANAAKLRDAIDVWVAAARKVRPDPGTTLRPLVEPSTSSVSSVSSTPSPRRHPNLFAEFDGNPPARASCIKQVEREAGIRLPEDYVRFLRRTDGGEGFVGEAYLRLWSVDELMDGNMDLEVEESAPGLFLFGSNGGGEACAFDMRTESMPVVAVPFIGMELEAIWPIASTFDAFLQTLFEGGSFLPPKPVSHPPTQHPKERKPKKLDPIQRLDRLEGIVDYHTRAPSTVAEVVEVCRQIAGTSWSADSPPVRLSGVDWRVVDVVHDGDVHRALLFAERVVGKGPYHADRADQVGVTWERCDLRGWLNDAFFWSLGEPLTSRVVESSVRAEPNPTWGTAGGNDTTDRVFLLSMKEVAEYLVGNRNVQWKKFKGPSCWLEVERGMDEDDKITWWWLRSPGGGTRGAAGVDSHGKLYGHGFGVCASGGVRPAFWLDLQYGTMGTVPIVPSNSQ